MIDLHQALSVASDAAKAAGKRIMQGYEEDLDVEVKSDPVDRVTQVDRDSQEIIEGFIHQAYPDHGTLGEEDDGSTDRNPDSSYRWVIDPIDGTSNFIQGLPHVGVSIALQYEKKSVMGLLYFPVYDHLYTAIEGEGAKRNAQKISIRDCERMRDGFIAEIFSDRMHRGSEVVFPPGLAFRKFGSAVTSLAYLSDGRIQATALRCALWDIAAADIIIREAGGRVEIDFDDPDNERSYLSCFAAVPGIFDEFKTFALTQYERQPDDKHVG